MAFKIQLLADVAGVLRGTKDVAKGLDEVADHLDGLARDTKQNADKAADSLEREFSDALDSVRKDTKDTSRKMGTDLKDGTRTAGEGFDDLKDEAKESAREAAASFSGEFEDIGDYIQEVLAQALSGFGPMGAAAGIAAAAGVGILLANLTEATDQANELHASISEVAEALVTDPGSALTDRIAKIRTDLLAIPEINLWDKITGKMPVAEFDRLTKAMDRAGLSAEQQATIAQGLAGDQNAAARAADMLRTRQDELNRAHGQGQRDATGLAIANREVTDTLNQLEGGYGAAADLARRYGDGMGAVIEANHRAAEASAEMSGSLTDNLSVADEGLDRFVKKGKLNLAEWTAELKRRAAETKAVQDFTVTIAPRLSPEALNNFAKLPVETQAQIAAAFRSGSKKDRKKITQNLEAEAKVTKVDINTAGAQKVADSKKIEIPTSVVEAGALKGTQQAADKAQAVANRSGNRIEFKTRLDDSDLQAQVNRAAARIRPPTIYAKVKAEKEVP